MRLIITAFSGSIFPACWPKTQGSISWWPRFKRLVVCLGLMILPSLFSRASATSATVWNRGMRLLRSLYISFCGSTYSCSCLPMLSSWLHGVGGLFSNCFIGCWHVVICGHGPTCAELKMMTDTSFSNPILCIGIKVRSWPSRACWLFSPFYFCLCPVSLRLSPPPPKCCGGISLRTENQVLRSWFSFCPVCSACGAEVVMAQGKQQWIASPPGTAGLWKELCPAHPRWLCRGKYSAPQN